MPRPDLAPDTNPDASFAEDEGAKPPSRRSCAATIAPGAAVEPLAVDGEVDTTRLEGAAKGTCWCGGTLSSGEILWSTGTDGGKV